MSPLTQSRVLPPALVDLSARARSYGRPETDVAEGPGGLTLVAFPPAGAGAMYFAGVFEAFLPQVRVVGVQYPGRQSRFAEEPRLERAELVDEAATALRTMAATYEADTPLELVLLGHSLGAQLAFETALALRGDNRIRVQRVILSARDHTETGGHRDAPDPRNASDADLVGWLHGIGGVPDVVLEAPDLVEMVARQLRADLIVSCDRGPEGTLDVPLVLLCGAEDSVASADRMAGWSQRTSAETTTITVPGDHDAIRTSASHWVEQAGLRRAA